MMIKAIEWCVNSIRFLDQTGLPCEERYIQTDKVPVIAEAIQTLKIRGAPLLGIAAAYAVALEAIHSDENDLVKYKSDLSQTIEFIGTTRPTAVNLFWALNRMNEIIRNCSSVEEIKRKSVEEAKNIHDEDREMCRMIGINGVQLLPSQSAVLTHCNTGALATGGSGTALGIITTAHMQGKDIKVYVDETRPLLQGARLTAWELTKHGIDVTLITDSMAAFLMQQKKITAVIVGADRITANGDVVNKIGTYNIAVIAGYHRIPFYVAAPYSTLDHEIRSADDVVIEERSPDEIKTFRGFFTAPEDVKVFNPAFDRTPASLVTAIITDRGVHMPPFDFS